MMDAGATLSHPRPDAPSFKGLLARQPSDHMVSGNTDLCPISEPARYIGGLIVHYRRQPPHARRTRRAFPPEGARPFPFSPSEEIDHLAHSLLLPSSVVADWKMARENLSETQKVIE
jgi:hypothetical protein